MFEKSKTEEKPKAETKKKTRKVKSRIKESLVTIEVVMGEGVEPFTLELDTSKLGQVMKDVLTNYGASTRLVGSAGGREGQEAVDAIKAARQELVDGTWSPRKPAEKFSKKDLEGKLAQLPEEERKAARETLAKIGVTI